MKRNPPLHLASEHVVDEKVGVGRLLCFATKICARGFLEPSYLSLNGAKLEETALAEEIVVASVVHRLDVVALAACRVRVAHRVTTK